MKTALLKQGRNRWATALCTLVFPALLVPPIIGITTSKASAQVSDAWGAGKGGDGGATDLSAKFGLLGDRGEGGKGGTDTLSKITRYYAGDLEETLNQH